MTKNTLFLLAFWIIGVGFCESANADWIVAGQEVVENDSIVVDGNLIVKAGGSLILRNVTLRINVRRAGEYRIATEPGASLFIYNSDIGPMDSTCVFLFLVNGAKFVFKNNTLRGVGLALHSGWENLGLSVYKADNAVLESNTIYQTTGSGIAIDHCRYVNVVGNAVIAERRGGLWCCIETFRTLLYFKQYLI